MGAEPPEAEGVVGAKVGPVAQDSADRHNAPAPPGALLAALVVDLGRNAPQAEAGADIESIHEADRLGLTLHDLEMSVLTYPIAVGWPSKTKALHCSAFHSLSHLGASSLMPRLPGAEGAPPAGAQPRTGGAAD